MALDSIGLFPWESAHPGDGLQHLIPVGLFQAEEPILADHALRVDEEHCAIELSSWPGNVRQLRNALERAAILARGGTIRTEHLRSGGLRGRAPGLQTDHPADLHEKLEISKRG